MAPSPELKSGNWYTIGDKRYLSVTAALDHLDAPGLMIWSANLAAEHAVDNLPALVAAMRTRPCGAKKREDRCGTCLPCWQIKAARQHWFKSEEAKRRGSAIHDVIEFWAQRGEWPAYDRAYEPYVVALRGFLDEFGLNDDAWMMTEATVYHDADEWAGTLDGIIRIKPATKAAAEFCARLGRVDQHADVLIDTKTREGEGARFYAQQPLQLAGYRHAEQVLVGGGRSVKMPSVHGGAVLQLRPDGWTMRPIRCGPDEYKTFCSVLQVARWMLSETGGDKATQVQAFPVPDEWMWRLPKDATVSDELDGVASLGRAAAKRTARKAAGAGTRTASRGRAAVDERAGESPTLASIRKSMPVLPKHGQPPAHPDSPYGDEVPF